MRLCTQAICPIYFIFNEKLAIQNLYEFRERIFLKVRARRDKQMDRETDKRKVVITTFSIHRKCLKGEKIFFLSIEKMSCLAFPFLQWSMHAKQFAMSDYSQLISQQTNHSVFQ